MRKVLIVGNVPIPSAAKSFGINSSVGGGWISGFIDALKEEGEYEISFAFPLPGGKDIRVSLFDGVHYYSFPAPRKYGFLPIINPCKSSRKMRTGINKILALSTPDILHVFGSEYVHAAEFIKAYGCSSSTLLHIQGISLFLGTHFSDEIPWHVRNMIVPSSIITGTIQHQKNSFMKAKAKNEAVAMRGAGHILGRTDWDRACVSIISPASEYHHVGEILREPFYSGKWCYEACEKHSIYMSQISSTFKGFHIFLKALPMIVAKYPDCKVYVAGREHVSGKGIKAALRRSSYSCYLRHLIKKNKLWNNLIFLGPLSAEGVKERLLNSNVFVSSSIIENSPNSLGEAMMLGVPCVASDVGGTTSMCSHNHECFIYQANAAYMLAYYVCRIFAEQDTAKVLSENACEKARNNHSRVEIVNEQLAIYKAILSSS